MQHWKSEMTPTKIVFQLHRWFSKIDETRHQSTTKRKKTTELFEIIRRGVCFIAMARQGSSAKSHIFLNGLHFVRTSRFAMVVYDYRGAIMNDVPLEVHLMEPWISISWFIRFNWRTSFQLPSWESVNMCISITCIIHLTRKSTNATKYNVKRNRFDIKASFNTSEKLIGNENES